MHEKGRKIIDLFNSKICKEKNENCEKDSFRLFLLVFFLLFFIDIKQL